MNGNDKAFQNALADFMHDFASGGAIRHLADLGYTVTEITEQLSFPTPKDRVAETVWKHYLEKGIILLKEPKTGETLREIQYVREQGPYGKVTMRQVVKDLPMPDLEYVPLNFGRQRYQDEKAFQDALQELTEQERQYVEDLPWPLQTVWHVRDERIKEILRKWKG